LPLTALLQLLFPVLLRDNVRAYFWTCTALIAQSAILIGYWLAARYLPSSTASQWSIPILNSSLLLVTISCFIAALCAKATMTTKPNTWEWIAFFALILAAIGRILWLQRFDLYDFGTGVLLASAAAVTSLVYRRIRLSPTRLTTQRLFLLTLLIWNATVVVEPFFQPNEGIQLYGDWRTFRGNDQRSGSVDPADVGPGHPRVLWRSSLGLASRIYSSPAIVGNDIIVIANESQVDGFLGNTMFRIDATTGKSRQKNYLGRAGVSSPAIRNGLIMVGEGYHEDRECRLNVIDGRTLKILNSFTTTSHVESSPTIHGQSVYFGAGEDGIYCIQVKPDGTIDLAWHAGGHHVDASPLVVEQTVYVGSLMDVKMGPPSLLAFNAVTGQPKWKVPTSLSTVASPAYHTGRVFFGMSNGTFSEDAPRPAGALWCVDADSGQLQWEFKTDAGICATPVCDETRVFIVDTGGMCRCIQQSDGKEVWSRPLSERVVASPIVSGGGIFLVTQQGTVFKLNAKTSTGSKNMHRWSTSWPARYSMARNSLWRLEAIFSASVIRLEFHSCIRGPSRTRPPTFRA
jgi:outer membrane protein assembly factor BamB